MNNGWPSKEEDIDIFFKKELEDASDDSSFHELSWDKISEQLDLINTPINNQIDFNSSLHSGKSIINSSGTSSFIGTITSVKVLIVGGILSGIVAAGYLIISSKMEHSNDITDSITEHKRSLPIVPQNSDSVSSKQQQNESVRSQPANQPKELIVINLKENNRSEELTLSGINANESPSITNTSENPSPEIHQEEVKKEPTESEVSEKKEGKIDETTENETPAKDYREQMLEKAKKKSRPIFTPKN